MFEARYSTISALTSTCKQNTAYNEIKRGEKNDEEEEEGSRRFSVLVLLAIAWGKYANDYR